MNSALSATQSAPNTSHTKPEATTGPESSDEQGKAPVTKTLSERLREVSFSGHGRADDWAGSADDAPTEPRYATAYMRGGLNTDGIAAQVAQHFLMYEALEGATARHRERQGADFVLWMPELHRLPALRADLQHWLGDDWEEQVRSRYATPGIMQYVDRITEVAPDSFPHFVAHHYTRYLADLSGGLMIAKAFRRSYDIDGDAGTTFYTFEGIDDPRAYKQAYRELLDTLNFTEEELEVIADEVALAYRLNNVAGADLEARFEEYRA